MIATMNGRKECVTELIRAGADANMMDANNAIALHYAAFKGKDECLEQLLTTSIINHTDSNGFTALLGASQNGFTKCVDLLLKAGADVNIQTRDKNTALILAATWGHPQCLQLMIDAGADMNIQTEDKSTALMGAAAWDHLECVKLLLSAGADVNFATPEWSAIHRAASYANHRCVNTLLLAGADVNNTTESILVDVMNSTTNLCRMAFQKGNYILENHNYVSCVKLLIEAGADVNMADKQGFTPLINAARLGLDDCIDLLIQAGASVNQADNDGVTPVVEAAILGTPKCLHRLISAGANVNTIRKGGRTALMECVWYSQEWWDEGENKSKLPKNCKQRESVEILINAGVNVNARTNKGISAIMRASENGYDKCVKLLLESGADVNTISSEGLTTLMYSAMFGREACTNTLLGAGADVNDYCKKGHTPLIYSAMFGHEACLKSLINAGADVNAKDDQGFTALLRAAHFANIYSIEMLVRAGVDFKLAAKGCEKSKFMDAMRSEYSCLQKVENTENVFLPSDVNVLKCIEALITSGADVNFVNNRGRTALVRAAEIGNIPVIKCLLKANCCINKMMAGVWSFNVFGPHILHGYPYNNNISMLLFAAGEKIDYSFNQQAQNILKLEDPEIHLRHICREAIRKHLMELDPHQHLFGRIPQLGLPSALSRYLLYDQSLDDDNGE